MTVLFPYYCFVWQGWTTGPGSGPACVVDVDECAGPAPPCSVAPRVACVNTAGGFTCGSCPAGYTGNGFYCADVDECASDNGGCSLSPRVQCINTLVGGSVGDFSLMMQAAINVLFIQENEVIA